MGFMLTRNLVDFYSNLGFNHENDFSVLQAETLGPLPDVTLPKIGARQIQRVAEFDCRCFGGDRKKLLESIILEKSNLSYYMAESESIVGYVTAKVYEKMA